MHIIKHLVLPGGSIYGLAYYGSIKYLAQHGLLKMDNIKTMHCTSIGAIIGTMMSMNYDWQELDNYIVNRPWQNVFKFSLYSIMNCFKNNGIFGIEVIQEMFLPLFNGKDISIDVTMKDFYDITGKELHFFTIDLITFELIDLSYKTHPGWTVIESIYSTACVPVLFKPLYKNNRWYIDAGILDNCPIKPLFDDLSINPVPDEVLRINIEGLQINDDVSTFENFTLWKYLVVLISKIINAIRNLATLPIYKVHNIFIEQNIIPVYDVHSVVNDPEQRTRLINYGEECAKEFIDTLNNCNI
jgi:hypothetical protein